MSKLTCSVNLFTVLKKGITHENKKGFNKNSPESGMDYIWLSELYYLAAKGRLDALGGLFYDIQMHFAG